MAKGSGKLSAEVTERICTSIRGLSGRYNACKKEGIAYSTFRRWFRDSETFANAIKEAELEANDNGKEVAIQAIFAAMPKAWQSAAWWLERKYKEEFSQRMDHSGEITTRVIRYPDRKPEGSPVDAPAA